jgi:hypothetical protein
MGRQKTNGLGMVPELPLSNSTSIETKSKVEVRAIAAPIPRSLEGMRFTDFAEMVTKNGQGNGQREQIRPAKERP